MDRRVVHFHGKSSTPSQAYVMQHVHAVSVKNKLARHFNFGRENSSGPKLVGTISQLMEWHSQTTWSSWPLNGNRWMGWGARVKGTNELAAGFWNGRLSLMLSNYREMMSVLMALKSFSFPQEIKFAGFDRQCDHSSIYQSTRWSKSGPFAVCKGVVDGGTWERNSSKCMMHSNLGS